MAHETTVQQVHEQFVPPEVSCFMKKEVRKARGDFIQIKDTFFQMPALQIHAIKISARDNLNRF